MTTKTGLQNKEAWIQLFLFVGLAVIYLSFPTRAYFFDGIAFAQAIEEVPAFHSSLFHPNHLIYNLVGSIFYRLILHLGFDIRAVAALQILNSLLSALSAYVLFVTLKSSLKSRYLCYCLTLLFAFSATWWKFSTDAGAYIPSILFLLISFYLSLPARNPRPLLVALTFFLALCLHQIAIIAFPAFVVALFLQGGALTPKRRLVNILLFSGMAALLTIAAYSYSFYAVTGKVDFNNLMRWTVSYAPDESFGFHAWNNLGFTLRGHFRLFFGGRLNAISGLVNPFIIVVVVLLVGVLVAWGFQVIRHFKKPDFKRLSDLRQDSFRRILAVICILWCASYLVFLYFLLAHHTFYRLFYLPALIILVGLILDSYKSPESRSRNYRLALFVAVVFLTNFLTLIYPYSHVRKYPPLALALEMNQAWPTGTIVYYGSPNSDNSLVRYFNPGTNWKPLSGASMNEMESALSEAKLRGSAVWLETSAIDQLSANPEGRTWLSAHTLPGSERGLVTPAHNIRLVQIVEAKK